jgi:ribonuclease J
MLKIIPLGGLGEIGLNMMVFEWGDTLFLVDAGLMFPEDYMLGVDMVIPDTRYLKPNASKIAGIVITHAHEDHIGALPYLLRDINPPIFATPFTIGILRHKLKAHGLLSNVSLNEISPQAEVRFGPFHLEFFDVSHSVVDGIGLAISTPLGRIVHTGDFRISYSARGGMGTDLSKLALYGKEGVLALLSDSTNVEREGYTIPDAEVGKTLLSIIEKSPGRIIVALFASSIVRIQQVIDIACATGRQIVITGRSIEASVQIARQLGYLTIPAKVEIDVQDISSLDDDRVVIITTGSQGEPMAALARMASGSHKQIKIKQGDTVILSSKIIPGNEKAIGSIINNLYKQGAEVIYEKISAIHVSGHAFREELKLMINLTRPHYFIPIHGEYRHLALHARLAERVGIPRDRVLLIENGQSIEFDEDGGRIGDSYETGRVLVDGKGIGDVGRSVLKERRLLSEDGLVAVTLAFDEDTGIIVYGPEIVSRGFVFETETGHLLEDAKCVILEIVEEIIPETANRLNMIRGRIQTDLRRYFYFTIKRRPVVLPFILEV